MSIEALSLVCNIITVIDFSHKFYETCRKINDSNQSDEDAENQARELNLLSIRLQQSRKVAGQTIPEKDQLLRVADQCLEAAKSFQSEVDKLIPRKSSSRISQGWNSLTSATKRHWRSNRIDQLNNTMQDCRQTMQTAILVDMHNSGLVDQAMRHAEFKDLEARMRNFAYTVSQTRDSILDLFAENQALHRETRTVMEQELKNINDVQKSLEDQKRLRGSLKFPGFNQRYNEIKAAHKDSFRWLLGDAVSQFRANDSEIIQQYSRQTFGDFDEWLKADGSVGLYWVSGKPGAGKSTLMKFLFREIKARRGTGDFQLAISHFFWLGSSNSRSRQNDMEGMYSTLLYQLLDDETQSSLPLVAALLKQIPSIRKKDTYTDWSLDELQDTTHAALNLFEDQNLIYILLDALDEHLPSDEHADMLSSIMKLEAMPNVRLVVSSRRERIFEKGLAHSRQLRLEQLTASDIYHFALDSLHQDAESAFGKSLAMELLEDLAQLIVNKAEGVFFWARLAVESVRRGIIDDNTETELRERLSAMPTKLADYFKPIWARLGVDSTTYQTKAANIFSLLLCDAASLPNQNSMVRPSGDFVGPGLICLALALTPDDAISIINGKPQISDTRLLEMCQRTHNTIMSHCAGLVEFDSPSVASDRCLELDAKFPDPNKAFRFIHRTAIDFFRETVDGKEIVDLNDIGSDGPNFRLMLGFLAQAVAFRKPPHEAANCSLIQGLKLFELLDHMHPMSIIGSRFTSKQRHFLVSQCHTVYYRFCGPLENAQFARWQLTDQHIRVHNFVSHVAYRGLNDYVESWIRDKSCHQHLPLEACNALLMENLSGHSRRIIQSLVWKTGKFDEHALAFQNSIFSKLHGIWSNSATDGQELLGPVSELNLRLPSACVLSFANTTDMVSTSDVVLQLVTALIACYQDLMNSSTMSDIMLADSVADMVLQLLRIFTSFSDRLSDTITCRYNSILDPKEHGSLPSGLYVGHCDTWNHPHCYEGKYDRGQFQQKTLMTFETTPLWLIQWLVGQGMAWRPEDRLTHGLVDLLQSINKYNLATPKLRLLSLYFLEELDSDIGMANFYDSYYKDPPLDRADYILEPLVSWLDDIRQWELCALSLEKRCDEIRMDAKIPISTTYNYPQHYSGIRSLHDNEMQRLAKACGVRMCCVYDQSGSILIIPPINASKEDKAFSRVLMDSEAL